MKLVMLTYLEGDEKCVEGLLSELEVGTFSRLAVEGHGPGGVGGWYSAASPYRSGLILVFAEEYAARRILDGVQACTAIEDPKHPIRAFLLGVEDASACGCQRPPTAGAQE
jgi:hypothetical protein